MLTRFGQTEFGGQPWVPDETLQALLDPLPFALGVVSKEGRISYCNKAWVGLGIQSPEAEKSAALVGRDDVQGSDYVKRLCKIPAPLADVASHLAKAIMAVTAGRLPDATFSYAMPRGRETEAAEAYVSAIPSSEGLLAVVQHRSVAQREQGAAARAVALVLGLEAEELRAQARRMGRRMENLAQEIHAPITPIRLELHLLSKGLLGPLTDAQRRALAVMERNIQRWINGEHAFLQAPQTGWTPAADIDLEVLVSAVVERRRTNAIQQGIHLTYSEPQDGLLVHASPDSLFDVLDLLLDRAISASPADAKVVVHAGPVDGEAVVTVQDAGASMSAHELDLAFEAWQGQSPSATVDSNLALYRIRQMVQKSGGRVWAKSSPGTGLLLGLAIPLLPGSPASAANDALAPNRAHRSRTSKVMTRG